MWINLDKNKWRNVEDFARLTGLELGTRGGSDNAIFKLILQLNVKNNCVL